MSHYPDLHAFIDALAQAGKLVRVTAPVNKDTELMPLVRWQYRGLPESERRAFVFENVTDSRGNRYDMPVGVALLGASREVYALGLQCAPDEITERWIRALDAPVAPVMVASGPAKDIIEQGPSLAQAGNGLDRIPLAISTPGWDPAPFLASPYWVTKDPDTGVRNVGTYRGMIKSPNRIGVLCVPTQHIGIHYRKYRERGQPMEAAVILGAQPVIGMASVAKLDYGVDEYGVAGGLAGEPIRLVKCETVDLEVPATAEIVLEGVIRTDYREPEAPFGEFTGHLGRRTLSPIFEIKCITRRRDAIYQTFISQLPPSESSVMRSASFEAYMYRLVNRQMGIKSVIEVAINQVCEHDYIGVRFKAPEQEDVWRALQAIADMDPTVAKVVIGVDDDIDPRDSDQIIWVQGFRVQPHRDIRVTMIGRRKESILDPSIAPPITDAAIPLKEMDGPSALLMNATRKWDYTPVSLPRREFMEHARTMWDKLGLPALHPRQPWYGYNLGAWEEENEQEARLAVEGRYYETGAKLRARGVIG